jgi:hypothetical protein
MLKPLRKATFALLACLLIAFGWQVWSASQQSQTPQNHSDKGHQGAAKNKNSANEEANPSSRSYLQKYSAYCAAKTIQENDKWRHDFWCEFKVTDLVIAIFAVVLAIVTAGLIIVGICQIRLARDEFIFAYRPKIVVRNVHISPDVVSHRIIGERLGVDFEIANIGGTSAVIVGTAMSINFLNIGILPMPRSPRPGKYAMPGWAGFEIAPGAFIQQWYGNPEVCYRADDLQNNPAFHGLFFVGHILYKDRSGIVRRTSFCRRFAQDRGYWPVASAYDYEHAD